VYFLFAAIESTDSESIKNLLDTNSNLLYCRDTDGNTPLIAATIRGWRKAIKLLIKKGADVNSQNRYGNTALHFSCALGDREDISRYLLKKNALSTVKNERGVSCNCKYFYNEQ
jgi:ankyrin repeat protein